MVLNPNRLEINDDVSVPEAELTYKATRSGGPGGQHANTTATRIQLSWSVADTDALDETQRARVMKRLSNRIDNEGVLHLTEAGTRSQHQNKKTVTERFREELARALVPPKKRKRRRGRSRAADERRLRNKKRRGRKKRKRGRIRREDWDTL